MKGHLSNVIDLASGQIFYNGNEIRSTKYPFLRPVQYALTRWLLKAKDQLSYELFSQMPKPLKERIPWLQKKGILRISNHEIQQITTAYTQALHWYHFSQKEFEKGNKVIQVDPQELQTVGQTISTFVCQAT